MKEVKDPEILKHFKESPPMDDNRSLLDKVSGYAGKFNKAVESSRLPSLAGGFLQGAGDMGASIANIPLEMVGAPKIPHPHLEKYLPQDLLSKGAFLGGELGSGIPGWLGIQGKISKLLPRAEGFKRIGKEAIAGAGTGYALGDEMPGGRLMSAGLGSLAIPATGLSSKNISKNIIEQRNKVTKEYNKKYEDVFKTAKNAGLDIIKPPQNIDYKLLKEQMESNQYKSLQKLINTPTIENAHRAQSDLGKFISENKNKSNASETNKAIKEAIIAQKKLRGKIHSEFSKVKGLSPEYRKVTKGYEKDVVPYKYNENINKYLENKLKPSSLVSQLSKSDEFMIKQGKKYPELQLQALLRSPIGKLMMGSAAVGAGLPPAYQFISSHY